jgi:aminotransferase
MAALSGRIGRGDVSFRTRMLELARDLPDVIPLGRGDPDLHTPKHIVEAAEAAIDANQDKYTHPAGLPELREAIARKLKAENNLDYIPEEVIVTDGVQQAITLCMLALVEKGDEVLLASPLYAAFDAAARLCGGVPVSVPTFERDDFALMPTAIEARLTERSKLLVLVTPSNPTGAVTPPAVIEHIADLAQRHDLVVISDELYEKLIYEGSDHLSIASLPGMKERTVTLNGFSKAYAMTGWRVGYMAGPESFIRKLVDPRHTLSISTSTPSQFAALAALTGPQDAVEEMRQIYARRRAYMMKALDQIGLTYGHPGGAFFIYANISSTGLPAPQFCDTLLRRGQVLIFPGTMYGDESEDYTRISYLQPLERIEEAVARMERVIAECRV